VPLFLRSLRLQAKKLSHLLNGSGKRYPEIAQYVHNLEMVLAVQRRYKETEQLKQNIQPLKEVAIWICHPVLRKAASMVTLVARRNSRI